MARILLVGRGAPERGGIAAFLQLLMSDRGPGHHRTTLLNLTPTGEQHGGRLDLSNLRRTLGDARALWRAIPGNDVVHVHTALAPLVTMLRASLFASIARLRGVPVLLHAHGGLMADWAGSRPRRVIARVLLAPATRIVTVAATVETTLRSFVAPARLTLVENGVDVARFAPTPEGLSGRVDRQVPRILYAGLLTPRKGVLDLLQASATLRAEGVEHELWLVGGTPDEGGSAESQVRRAAEGSGAQLLGTREHPEMPAIYDQADVFCLPSWWEAMPLTVLEAMASGLPVVATRVGDVPRMVHDGVSGRLVEPRDPDALADALRGLLTDRSARLRAGARGRDRAVERYDLERMLRQVDALYLDVHGAEGHAAVPQPTGTTGTTGTTGARP